MWDKLKKFTTSSAAQLLDQDESIGEGGSFDAMSLWKDDELQVFGSISIMDYCSS